MFNNEIFSNELNIFLHEYETMYYTKPFIELYNLLLRFSNYVLN